MSSIPGVSQQTLHLISRIYDAGLSSRNWPGILDELSDSFGALGTAIFYQDSRQPELNALVTSFNRFWSQDDNKRYYDENVAGDDPAAALLKDKAPRTIVTSENISLGQKLRIAPYAVKMWKRFGIRAVAAARLNDQGAWFDFLTFQFGTTHGPMRADELEQLSVLLPHVAKAMEITRPMTLLEQRFRAVLDALDRFHVGVMILTASGTEIISNTEAKRILEQRDGLYLSEKGLPTAMRETDQARLQQAIRVNAATAQADGLSSGSLLSIPRRSGRDAYLLEVVPLTDRKREFAHLFQGVMLFMVDPAEPGEVSTTGMQVLYQLTDAEAAVCRLLVEGRSYKEMADIRGVSPETVKSQVQSALRKTRTDNRSALIRLALSVNLPVEASVPDGR